MSIGKSKKFKLSFTLVLVAIVFTLCFASSFESQKARAQDCPPEKLGSEGMLSGFALFESGLVPCGRQCNDPRTTPDETDSCTLCHFMILIYNIYTLLTALLIIVALVFLTIGGVTYIVSSGNSSLKSTAKGIITKTLIGFAVFLLSWLIVYTVLFFISADPDNNPLLGRGGELGWYEYECNTQSAFDR